MSYTLACEAPEIFRAIGSVAGTMGGDTWENCTTTNKTPLIQFHGIDDDVIPIDGSGLPLGWGGAPRIRTIVDFWSNKNECSSLDSIQMTSNTERFIHSAGLGGNEVWYYEIANHGHEWPGSSEPGITDVSGIDASNIIWSFFKQFGNRMITHSDLYLEERCLSMYGLELLPEITLKGSLSQYTIEILNGQEQAISIIESTDDIYVLDPLNLGEEAMFIKVQSKSLIELGFQDLIPNGNF